MKVKFLPQDVELEIAPNQSVMKLAHENGIFVKSICNGVPSCAECRVKIIDGEQNVSSPSNKELNLIGTGYFLDQRRLSCQLRCFGDLVVDLSEQVEKQKSGPKKVLGNRKMDMDKSNAVNAMLVDSERSLRDQVLQERPGGGGGQKSKRRNSNRNRRS
jgi:ferredoxin, 2Fe-2S